MTGSEMESCDIPDKLTMLSYLSQIYDTFRGEIPHIRHPKLVIFLLLFLLYYFVFYIRYKEVDTNHGLSSTLSEDVKSVE